MTGEAKPEAEKAPRKKLTRAEKQAQHMDRLKRTAIACGMGILVGVISFYVDTTPPPVVTYGTALGILLLLAGIVFQKYVFLALRMEVPRAHGKGLAVPGLHDLLPLVHHLDHPPERHLSDTVKDHEDRRCPPGPLPLEEVRYRVHHLLPPGQDR